MEESESNTNLFEELNYKLIQRWKWYTDLEMQNTKQPGKQWEK